MPENDRSIVERGLSWEPSESGGENAKLLPKEKDETLKMLSVLPEGITTTLAGAYTIARVTHSKVLNDFCNFILQLQVSGQGIGRVQLLESIIAKEHKEAEEES